MVSSDIDNIILEQDRRVQEQATEGASLFRCQNVGMTLTKIIGTAREVLPRVHGRRRYQQGGEIHPLEIHAGEPRPTKRLSTVRFLPSHTYRDTREADSSHGHHHYSLTQATDTSNIRLVFAAVKETILQNALKDSGIL